MGTLDKSRGLRKHVIWRGRLEAPLSPTLSTPKPYLRLFSQMGMRYKSHEFVKHCLWWIRLHLSFERVNACLLILELDFWNFDSPRVFFILIPALCLVLSHPKAASIGVILNTFCSQPPKLDRTCVLTWTKGVKKVQTVGGADLATSPAQNSMYHQCFLSSFCSTFILK